VHTPFPIDFQACASPQLAFVSLMPAVLSGVVLLH